MKIAVCEDELFWRTQLENMVRRWAAERKSELSLSCFKDGESFWFAFLQEKDWDLLFLDIELGQENGMELAERIRQENEDVTIIFITGYADYMARGYDVGAMQYLLKPVEECRLYGCLDRVEKKRCREEKKLMFTTADQVRISIAPSRIWYMEAVGHNCRMDMQKECLELRMSFTAAMEALREEPGFMRCHRSYLVNLKYVREIRRSGITLDDGRRLPVSRSAYPEASEAFIRFYSMEKQRAAAGTDDGGSCAGKI